MSIETQVTLTLASVEVGNDYDVELTVTDPLTTIEVTTSLTPDQAAQLADELRDRAAAARESRAVDDVARAEARMTHAFDIDAPKAVV
ncbi:hypothetical protein QE430_002503 [Microbacterium testaceum]|uniref:hypothetical protein n=1 Tax=Microbacterium testaceum TaxID=2033 RepID=UPI00278A116F|nr:hypothetical protein [Microbacterium testaceum]MDQ1174196.1 hypothetical protein [Microbacterium testaceum]